MQRSHLRIVLAALGAAALCFAGIFAIAEILGVPVKILTRDPYWAAKVPPYYGYLSLLCSTIWLIGGFATLAAALLFRILLGSRCAEASTYRIVLIGGLLGSFMALDDILLFHDAMADFVGFPEVVFHGVYALAAVYLIVSSRTALRSTPWILLFGALGCYAASSLMDAWRKPPVFVKQSEDVFKFCGVVLWACYFLYVAYDYARVAAARGKTAD